ncbi:MAG: pyrroline-5-carboxylate reductase [Chloroflexi bacterium]|nr:pyrroline-5-carboxylate reductase [Chloroflexota bacterium]MDA1147465.1 pyrroline-5-carboxylate reductase [Chloroflexota bacterium]
MRVGLLGGGFMGEAFLRGLLRAGAAMPQDIAVAEISESRRTVLSEYGVRLTSDLESACIGAELVLVALKPQDVDTISSLRGALPSDSVLVSIAAGVTLGDLQRLSGHRACVRVMPNLPAAIGEGAAAYLVATEVTELQRKRLHQVLDAVSTVAIEVEDDEAVDLATALHGSGPAYVYYVIEAMIDAGVRLGMRRANATSLVLATVAGSARYAIENGAHPAELRNAVTSPGGTTAAALAELESAGVRAAFDDAIDAAFRRARELAEDTD